MLLSVRSSFHSHRTIERNENGSILICRSHKYLVTSSSTLLIAFLFLYLKGKMFHSLSRKKEMDENENGAWSELEKNSASLCEIMIFQQDFFLLLSKQFAIIVQLFHFLFITQMKNSDSIDHFCSWLWSCRLSWPCLFTGYLWRHDHRLGKIR